MLAAAFSLGEQHRVEEQETETKSKTQKRLKVAENPTQDEVRKAAKAISWLWQQSDTDPHLFEPENTQKIECQQLELQPEIWQRLPPALQEVIAAKLPLCSRIRSRCVCKLWSSPYAIVCQHHPIPCVFCVDGCTGTWSLYDPSCSEWHLLTPLVQHPVRVRSADRGLVCLEQLSSRQPLRAVVCNPITGHHRPLPLSPAATSNKPLLLQIAADALSYRLVRVDGDRSTWVYDSILDQWLPAECMPLEITHPPSLRPRREETYYHSVHCDGKIFALGDRYGGFWEFDMDGRFWVQTCTVDFPEVKCLLECGGDVFLASLEYRTKLHSLNVWRFNREQERWKKVTKVPMDVYPEFTASPTAVFGILGTKDFVMVTAGSQDVLTKTFCILAYNLREKNWHPMTPAGSPFMPLNSNELIGLSFHPYLDAMP